MSSSIATKVQNLIDFLDTNLNDDDEKTQSAPSPKPSTSDVDASKIKMVVLGCGLVVPPLIEVNINPSTPRLTHTPTHSDSISISMATN